MKRLDLSNNGLRQFPTKLCDLDLSILNLTNNQLSEQDFPLEAEKFQNLLELSLDSNNFKQIPKCISKLKRLERLSVRHNSMADLKFVHHLRNLKFLILEFNSIGNIEDNFSRLKKLEILHLGHNSLSKLDTNLLKSNMNYLKILDLSFNRLNTIAIEIFMLPHLQMLNLSNNKISMLPIMPTSYFRTIAICVCDLSSNKLIRFYEFLISVCDRIDLTSNKISTNLDSVPIESFQRKGVKNYQNLHS